LPYFSSSQIPRFIAPWNVSQLDNIFGEGTNHLSAGLFVHPES
jgi:hypothetical protein